MRVARTWLFKFIADEHIIGRPIAVFLIFVELIFLVLLLVLNVAMMESVQHDGPLTAFECLGLIVFFGLNCYFTAREWYQGLTMQRLGLWLAYCRYFLYNTRVGSSVSILTNFYFFPTRW